MWYALFASQSFSLMLKHPADTMKSLFQNGIFKIVIEMARSSDATFQKRGCQLLGTASRHGHGQYRLCHGGREVALIQRIT
jgi:hypothetical protein